MVITLQRTATADGVSASDYRKELSLPGRNSPRLTGAGFDSISQSTVSRLLKLLGVIKIRNAKGLKIYSLNHQLRPAPDAARTVSEMVVSVEHNSEFILIHTVAGYGRAVARILDYHQLPEILGVVAGSSIVWVAPGGEAHCPGAQTN
jgi:arginine repressor